MPRSAPQRKIDGNLLDAQRKLLENIESFSPLTSELEWQPLSEAQSNTIRWNQTNGIRKQSTEPACNSVACDLWKLNCTPFSLLHTLNKFIGVGVMRKTGRKWNRIDSFLSTSVKLMIPLTRRIFKNFHEFSLDRERSPNPNTTPSLLKNSLKVFTDELLPLKLHQDMSFSPLIPVSRYLDKAVPPWPHT